MKLKTSELKAFKHNASFVKTNGILPILGYLKVENGTITKTSLDRFLVQEIEAKGTVLLDENIFYNFLSRTPEQFIDVNVKDGRVTISDGGYTPKVSFQEEPVSNFPIIKKPGEEKHSLTNDVFCAINFASRYIDNMELPDARGYVFVGKKMVFGGNGTICYQEKFKKDLPQIVLTKDVSQVIGKFNEANFSEDDRYMFFETSGCTYGFVKSVYPFTDMTNIIKYSKDNYAFDIDRMDILNFAEMCVSSTKSQIRVSKLSVKSNKLFMDMLDPEFNVDVNHAVPIGDGKMEEDFTFNPVLMSTMLNNIPDNELKCYRTNNSLIFTGDSGFTSIIQQMTTI